MSINSTSTDSFAELKRWLSGEPDPRLSDPAVFYCRCKDVPSNDWGLGDAIGYVAGYQTVFSRGDQLVCVQGSVPAVGTEVVVIAAYFEPKANGLTFVAAPTGDFLRLHPYPPYRFDEAWLESQRAAYFDMYGPAARVNYAILDKAIMDHLASVHSEWLTRINVGKVRVACERIVDASTRKVTALGVLKRRLMELREAGKVDLVSNSNKWFLSRKQN